MKIYGDVASGNCQKVRLVADYLGLDYAWVPIDIMKGESRTGDYLARFPQGQVPALALNDGRCLSQSNAIMRYLARGSSLLPDDAWAQAKIDEWLFWEQYSHTNHTLRSAAFKWSIRVSPGKRARPGVSNAVRKPSI